jgi:hypothetical protein
MSYKLLTTKNFKTEKGLQFEVMTGILHLAPFTLSGRNVCPNASAGCSKACLNTSGHGRYDNVQQARLRRTMQFFNDREQFFADLFNDVETLVRRAGKNGLMPAIRPNGTSDIPVLALTVAKQFPDIQFYDYTKNLKTLMRNDLPANYHLTFSRSETNDADCKKALELGFNVAVVFGGELPKTFWGYKVINGELSDLRFRDKKNVIVGLTAKGRAKHDKTGFVVREY